MSNSLYLNRAETIGNNRTIYYIFEILHEGEEIDCEEAFVFDFQSNKILLIYDSWNYPIIYLVNGKFGINLHRKKVISLKA